MQNHLCVHCTAILLCMYSGTSENGPSLERTPPLERTVVLPPFESPIIWTSEERTLPNSLERTLAQSPAYCCRTLLPPKTDTWPRPPLPHPYHSQSHSQLNFLEKGLAPRLQTIPSTAAVYRSASGLSTCCLRSYSTRDLEAKPCSAYIQHNTISLLTNAENFDATSCR